MAQPSNTFDSYDGANSIKEDLSSIIENVSPEETPFYSACKKTKATNTFHEWQTDTLRAAATNAHIEVTQRLQRLAQRLLVWATTRKSLRMRL